MSNVLDDKFLRTLRENKVITEQEIAIREGDIVVAKNVLTDKKRIIDSKLLTKLNVNTTIKENKEKTLLKD